MARKKSRIPAVVPRIVFSTVFVGVIPACVAQACGGTTPLGVANQCFSATDPNCPQGVAAVAFQCFDGSTQPGCRNFSVADAAFGDAPLEDAFDAAGDADAADDADGAG